MENLQCLVSGVTNRILGDIIKRLLNDNCIKSYECSSFICDLASAVNDDVSHVIVGMGNKQLPREFKEIFNKKNDLIVIELLNNGKSLSLYMDDIDETVLKKIINI